jgi:hypothetical protein
MYGIPGMGGSREGGQTTSRRMGTEQWEVAVGVPPVIQPPAPVEAEDSQNEIDEEKERFAEWYRQVSEPWILEDARGRVGDAD